jgi:hypothetical protein
MRYVRAMSMRRWSWTQKRDKAMSMICMNIYIFYTHIFIIFIYSIFRYFVDEMKKNLSFKCRYIYHVLYSRGRPTPNQLM